MPTWSGILKELAESGEKGGKPPQFDAIRRKYLALVHSHTKRSVILYASKCTQSDPNVAPEAVSIVDEDIQGIMEVIHQLPGPNLDLILHSPGGSLEAAEAFVSYLRSKFENIRVIVPQMAMSAATMIACAADTIVLGKHSFLGPIDPQLLINTPLGQRMVPAQAILEQFKRAKRECQDPQKLAAWLPMLNQYGPDLLVTCENATKLSRTLVQRWLETYMFRDEPDAARKAQRIAKWLADHAHFKSHSRRIARQDLEEHGLKIRYLESDQTAQDLFLSVFHATTHTFSGTPAVKIVENHLGSAFIKSIAMERVVLPARRAGALPPGGALFPPAAVPPFAPEEAKGKPK